MRMIEKTLLVSFASMTLAFASFSGDVTLESRIEAMETGLRPSVHIVGTEKQRWSIEDRMAHYNVPGMSIVIIKDGKIIFAKGYGVKEAGTTENVDTNTVFSVGSLSKIGTAATTLRLTAAGEIDLNKDVNSYLKRWQVPSNEFTKQHAVTLRGILSHTSGLSLWGFPDFNPGEDLPTVLNTLDATGPARTEAVRAFYVPGSSWRYSGGGTTVQQLLLEDVTGLPFTEATQKYTLVPLGMSRSTYQNPLPASHGNIAKAHDRNGNLTALPRGWHAFPEMAASGLWSTPSDYAQMVIAFMESYKGAENSFLPQALAEDMMTPVGYGANGLGPQMSGVGINRRFSHGGANQSYRAWMEGHLERGTGMVLFTNGTRGGALNNEVKRAVADAFDWPYYQEVDAPDYVISEKGLKEFSGDYEWASHGPSAAQRVLVSADRDTTFTIKLEGGKLLRGRRVLIPVGPSQFICEGCDRSESTSYEFTRDIDGKVVGFTIRAAGDAESARKIP